jgi:hypothetical protein
MQIYFTVLEQDDQNCAAALGVANVLCEYGKSDESKQIYKLLGNSCENNPMTGFQARVNQAHCTMWEQNYDLAVNLYQSALELFPNNVDCSLYLSKAYFRKKDYQKSRDLLQKLAAEHPSDIRVQFNLAHVLYNSARDTFNLEVRQVSQSQRAIEDLKAAKSLFTQFMNLYQEHGNNLAQTLNPQATDQTRLFLLNQSFYHMYKFVDNEISFVNQILTNSEYYLIEDSNREQKIKQKEEEAQLKKQALEKERECQRLLEEEKERQRKQQQREEFQKLNENLGILDLSTTQKKPKKQKDQLEEDNPLDEDDMSANIAQNRELDQENSLEDIDAKMQRKREKKEKKKAEKKEKRRKEKELLRQGGADDLPAAAEAAADEEPKKEESAAEDELGTKKKRRMRKMNEFEEEEQVKMEAAAANASKDEREVE